MSRDIYKASAHWISLKSMAWRLPAESGSYRYFLHYSSHGGIVIEGDEVKGGEVAALTFGGIIDDSSLLLPKYPYLRGYTLISCSLSAAKAAELLRGQLVVVARKDEKIIAATSLQTYGIIDELYSYDGELGANFGDTGVPSLQLWAPTAKSVNLHLFSGALVRKPLQVVEMTRIAKGAWSVIGEKMWNGLFYLYEVEVFVTATGKCQRYLVTDPYSLSLSANSKKSQIVDLREQRYKPAGWDGIEKPALASFADITLYELHVRDFSIYDPKVREEYRGRFAAFGEKNSHGARHLMSLARSGLTHVHLLPVFDIATIEERADLRIEPEIPQAAADSSAQQEAASKAKDTDGFNWGYDPHHYAVPEGSYATDPQGSQRIIEFRKMVQALNSYGLRVVMDVVYNHTHTAGQEHRSILDKIVPGYYYRLDADGQIQNTSCCPDTASEHAMMEKLMVDTLLLWAVQYKIDGFRFDLMGHHTVGNLRRIRAELDKLTVERHGVDGKKIYLYGEGWRFGSLQAILPEQAFHQLNAHGEGIGTFNDRIRDSLRGGNFAHSTKSDQGFINGLYYDYNQCPDNSETPVDLVKQKNILLNYTDNIRLSMAGNLRDYRFTSASGQVLRGAEIYYRGSANAGYTAQPYECINYASAHDNYTLWDQIAAKAPFRTPFRTPATASAAERARMQDIALGLVALGQGIPFFHAGSEILRSKSGDGDSYNSGDWFNRLDFTYQHNNWGVGLPPAEKNAHEWEFWKPRLADPKLRPSREIILNSLAHFHRMLRIRRSSRLFCLADADEIQTRVRFLNAERGPEQIPGVIAMAFDDEILECPDIDSDRRFIACICNATREPVRFSHETLRGREMELHSVLTEPIELDTGSGMIAIPPDSRMQQSHFAKHSGTVTIPGRTIVVYEQK